MTDNAEVNAETATATETTSDQSFLAEHEENDSSATTEQEVEQETAEKADSEGNQEIPLKFLKDDGTVDVEALAKSYKELEKGPKIPDAYEDESFGELGLDWGEGEAAIAWKEEVHNSLKEAKITQKQFEAIMPLYSKAVNDLMGKYGPPVDFEKEKTELTKAWGDPDSAEFKQNQHQVTKFLKGLNRPELMQQPLHKTAAGMMLLSELAKSKVGPKFIKEETTSSPSDLRAELASLINDPAYGTATAKGKMLTEKADLLSEKLSRLK